MSLRFNFSNLSKLLLRVRRRHSRRNNNILSNPVHCQQIPNSQNQVFLLPVYRCRHTLLITRLQRVDHPQHLRSIPPRTSRIHHRQPNLLGRINYKHGADRKRNALLVNIRQVLLIHHVVEESDFSVCISDDGELEVRVGDFVDVFDPGVVRV
jgi:hypothetical protein